MIAMTGVTAVFRRVLGLLALGGASACLPVMAACPLPQPALGDGPVQALWRAQPQPIQTGQLFAVEVEICPADAALLKVEATMPEHQHGMNYRPSITRLASGHWRAEGLMFHMPGRWALRFDVQSGGRSHSLRDSVTLP